MEILTASEKLALRTRTYRKNHPDIVRNGERKAQERLKLQTIEKYSKGKMCCLQCGYSNIDALVLDHINDDGAEQRKILGGKRVTGICFYKKLRTLNFPSGFQVLCANCNTIKQVEKFRRERL